MWLFRMITSNPYVLLGVAVAIALTSWTAAWEIRGWKADSAVKTALEEQAKEFQKKLAAKNAEIVRRTSLAEDYEERKEIRAEKEVSYVEKPSYRDCVPDADWVREFSDAIARGNASADPR